MKHSLERDENVGGFRLTMRYEPWFEMHMTRTRGINVKADHKWVVEVKVRQRQTSADFFWVTPEQRDRLQCRVPHQRRIDAIKTWDVKRRELAVELAVTALKA